MTPLPAPLYVPPPLAHGRPRVGLAVGSMRYHTTDEGWQLFAGLESAGYLLSGHGLRADLLSAREHLTVQDTTDCRRVLEAFEPSTVVLQDKREWVGRTAGRGFDDRERFRNVGALRDRPDVFRVTVLKDAHSDHALHREAAEEAGVHAWVTYYSDDAVCRDAPFVRREHLVRTYHTVDAAAVPAFRDHGRETCLLSGAVGPAYPLRGRLFEAAARGRMPGVTVMRHPGYRRDGCHTPAYLRTLSRFRVAICTASSYQYLLRKTIEATACGCVVVTDLREPVPHVDGNMVRVSSDASPAEVLATVRRAARDYDPVVQRTYADLCKEHYDYRYEGARLARAVENLREDYE